MSRPWPRGVRRACGQRRAGTAGAMPRVQVAGVAQQQQLSSESSTSMAVVCAVSSHFSMYSKFGHYCRTLREGGDLARPGLARAIRPLLVGSGGAARSRHGSNEPRPPPFVKAVDNAGVAAWMPLAGRRRRCDRSVR